MYYEQLNEYLYEQAYQNWKDQPVGKRGPEPQKPERALEWNYSGDNSKPADHIPDIADDGFFDGIVETVEY